MMQRRTALSSGRRAAFTLVELLVSMAIMIGLLLLLVQTTDAVRKTVGQTSGSISQFKEARDALEALTRRLAQATLNTYWDYDNPTKPTAYQRQSELRFISGPTEALLNSSQPKRPGNGVFFQAPAGFVNKTDYSQLSNLLNTWGFYVEWGSDEKLRPPFATEKMLPYRWRFRLMEMMEPSEELSLYKFTSGLDTDGSRKCINYTKKDWFTIPMNIPSRNHVLAENILYIAIVATSPTDSNSFLTTTATIDTSPAGKDKLVKNQLPPLIFITMCAVDETSFGRYQASRSSTAPTWMDGKWATTSVGTRNTEQAAIETELQKAKILYRKFTTQIVIPGAKWSPN